MSDDERILRRFTCFGTLQDFVEPGDVQGTVRTGIILDTETTGVDTQLDEIIEVGMVVFDYDESGLIVRAGVGQSWLNEPAEKEISEKIVELTGITPEMVAGKSLPPEIDEIIGTADVIVAHHAAFDRPIVERYFPVAAEKPWLCSMDGIDWIKLGAPGKSLQAAAWWHGFFFEGHQAVIDCEALAKILAEKPALAGEPLFPGLLEAGRQRTTRIFAVNAPFERKDDLKARGYQWHDGTFGVQKAWYRDLPSEEAKAEQEWLAENLPGCRPAVREFGAATRYSRRTFA